MSSEYLFVYILQRGTVKSHSELFFFLGLSFTLQVQSKFLVKFAICRSLKIALNTTSLPLLSLVPIFTKHQNSHDSVSIFKVLTLRLGRDTIFSRLKIIFSEFHQKFGPHPLSPQ